MRKNQTKLKKWFKNYRAKTLIYNILLKGKKIKLNRKEQFWESNNKQEKNIKS